MKKRVDWKKYFTKEDLAKGHELYLRGNCLNILKSDDSYRTAVVDGSKAYNVVIKVNYEGKYFAFCSCKSSRRACAHIAALSEKVEKDDKDFFIYEERFVPYDPFDSYGDEEEYVFSIKRIFSSRFLFSKEEWEKAGETIKDGEFTFSASSKKTYGGRGLETHGIYGRDSSAFMEISDERVLSITYTEDNKKYSLDCMAFKPQRVSGIVLALIKATCDYIKKTNPGDTTNEEAEALLGSIFSSLKIKKPTPLSNGESEGKKEGKTKVLDIVPVLDVDNNKLTFSIKDEKNKISHQIKDIKGFLLSVKQGGDVSWGKSFTASFSRDEKTKRFVSVLSFIDIVMTFRENIYPHKGFIPVDVGNIDLVYNLADETELINREGKRVSALEKPLRLDYKFMVKSDSRGEREISVTIKPPFLMDTYSGFYNVKDDTIIKYDLTSLGALEDFLKNRRNSYGFTLVFGKNSIPSFYNSVLPLLMENGEVDLSLFKEREKWAFFNPTFTFYLDYEESLVKCFSIVTYGDVTYKLGSEINYEEGRNESMEKWAMDQVSAFFPYYNSFDYYWSTLKEDDDSIYSLLVEGVEILQKIGEVHITESFKRLRVRHTPSIRSSVVLNGDLLNLKIESEDVDYKELLKILSSYKRRRKYHRLKDGSFMTLDEGLEGIGDLVDGLGLGEKSAKDNIVTLPSYKSLYLDSLLEGKSITVDRDVSFRSLVKDFKGFADSSHEPPLSLKSILRPYQKDGMRWFRTLTDYRFGGILADEMGLGKTLEVIATLLSIKEDGIEGTSLVVAPSSLVFNWESEVKKFAPSLSSCVVTGSPQNREKIIREGEKYDLLITSYDLLKRDLSRYKEKSYLSLIIDEAQYIKNSNTENAKSVKDINAKYRFALTGTPIENRLLELWSIFDFLMPGFLGSKEEFTRNYEYSSTSSGNSEEIKRLKKIVSPFILRRRKEDVLKDLPEKIEENVFVSMLGEQRKLYDAEVVKMKSMVEKSGEEELNKEKIAILSSLMKIREICCDPSLVYEGYNGGSAKLDTLLELLDRALDEGHRVLIFSQFVSMLKIIAKEIESRYNYYMITGETDKEERLELVNSFNKGSVPIFLISLKAGGTGLNLTGADIVIHYDPWWNVAVQNQATDRAHRIGQTKVVTVYKLLANNSIEEKIAKLQEMKKNLSDGIMEGEGLSLSSLTKEDLLEILS